MTPAVLQFAQDYAGQVKIVQVNVIANPTLSTSYNVTAVPDCIFFMNGSETSSKMLGSYTNSMDDEDALIELFDEI